jgi:hypothetical protein
MASKPIVKMIPKKWFNRMQYWLTAYAAWKLLDSGLEADSVGRLLRLLRITR